MGLSLFGTSVAIERRRDVTERRWATCESVCAMCEVPSSAGGRRSGSEPCRSALGTVYVERYDSRLGSAGGAESALAYMSAKHTEGILTRTSTNWLR
jgi:hypothetical protein